MSSHVRSRQCQLRRVQFRSRQIMSDQYRSSQVRTDHVRSDQIRSCPVRSGQDMLVQFRSGQISSMTSLITSDWMSRQCQNRTGQSLVTSGQVRPNHCLVCSGHVKVTLVHVRLGQDMTMSGQIRSGQAGSRHVYSRSCQDW